jgi:putative zinc finger/helix-turn-helix YgiT family protein
MMPDVEWCVECGAISARRIEKRTETYLVRNEPITVEADVAVCSACGADVADPELDDVTLKRAYAEYRRRHNLLAPEAIKALRERYDLGQKAFGRLLGWGEVTIHRYESGAIPDEAHNNVLLALQDEVTMHHFIETQTAQRAADLSELDRRKIRKASRQRAALVALAEIEHGLRHLLDRYSPTERGHHEFSLKRFGQMVIFFIQPQMQSRVKLLKDLFYADFLAFKRLGHSLSGAVYLKYPHGPVPAEYQRLLGALEGIGLIEVEASDYLATEGWRTRYDYKACVDFDAALFTAPEREVLQTVYLELCDKNASQASAMSHQETAWKKTKDWEIISYEKYARELSVA